MSTNNEYDDFEDFEDEYELDEGNSRRGSNPVRDLRKQLAQEKKARKELEASLAALRGESRKKTIEEVLSAKGANPRLAKYVANDLGDEVSPDGVAKWLETEGEVFGYKPAEQQDNVDVGEVDEAARQAAAAAGGAPPMPADLMAKIAEASSQDEVNEVLRAAKTRS